LFDSLKYAKILEESGVPRDQAETHIRVLNDLMEGEVVATKQDLEILKSNLDLSISSQGTELRSEISNLGAELRSEISSLAAQLRSEIGTLAAELRSEMNNQEHRIVYKLGGLMVAISTLTLTVTKLIG